MHLSKHWDDQACVIGDRCQWLFVSHWYPMASCFLLHWHCSHWAQKAWTQSCRTGSTAKFFAEVAFDWSARISSVPNRFTVNDVTSSALTVSREGAHASITVGTVHRIGDRNVSSVLHRMEIWLSICLRIFLRVCLIIAVSSLVAGCFVPGDEVCIAVATSRWTDYKKLLSCKLDLCYLPGLVDSEIDIHVFMKVMVHEQSALMVVLLNVRGVLSLKVGQLVLWKILFCGRYD